MSMIIDGRFYQDEGRYMCLDTQNYSSYALPLTGGNMTGNIGYTGTKASCIMIRFIDNTSDAYGNGIAIGGGGATIVGGGEAANVCGELLSSGGDERLILANDNGIDIYTNCQNGTSSATHVTIDANGVYSGTASSAYTIKNQGNATAITGVIGTKGLSLQQVYNNGYPTSYGNVLSIGGDGDGQILAGWSGSNNGIARLYYRNRRDMCNTWSDWKTIAYTSDIQQGVVAYGSNYVRFGDGTQIC